jgi:hypothetical protein
LLLDAEGSIAQHPLPQEILGILCEQDYRRYPIEPYKDNAINKLRLTFTDNSDGIQARQAMLAGYATLRDFVSESSDPLKAAFQFVFDFSPLARNHRDEPAQNTLLNHLKEVTDFARDFILVNDDTSRFPRLLNDRHAILIAHVAAPLHDLMKYLGPPKAQIMPDHEIMAAELVHRIFEGKSIDVRGVGEIKFSHADCEFLSSLLGDHENIEKEAGRTRFILSESVTDRAKAIFSVLDTLTGVIKPDDTAMTNWCCDRAQLDLRFTDLVYRHIDQEKGKIFRPEWAATTIKDLSYTVGQLSRHGVKVSGSEPGETFQQALARSGLRAIELSLKDDQERRELNEPKLLLTAQQIELISNARQELTLLALEHRQDT